MMVHFGPLGIWLMMYVDVTNCVAVIDILLLIISFAFVVSDALIPY